MTEAKPIRVLFVCMGNICRSPSAEAVFRQLVRDRGLESSFVIDSAGTHGFYHEGSPPDRRSLETARKRGIEMSDLRARPVKSDDFFDFDYILAMDRPNLYGLVSAKPEGTQAKIELFLTYAPELGVDEVPDPYYGGPQGFDHVLDLIETASEALLNDLTSNR